MVNGNWSRALLVLGAIMAAAAPAATQERQRLNAVSALQPGLWELRDLDQPKAPRRAICVADPQSLLQIEHRGSPCSRLVVSADQNEVTVHYTCPADGFGQTSIRVVSPQLARIDTQGIKNKQPFLYRADARRVRSCR